MTDAGDGAAALIAVFTGADPEFATGRGTGEKG
jgi:hypothetical protein